MLHDRLIVGRRCRELMFCLTEWIWADRVEALDWSLVANVAPWLAASVASVVLVLLHSDARTVVIPSCLWQET